ncbi:T9SS type A sorting domain-containing protein [Moheibacter sediminis]|uniref:Por secretion system C-terminal sorting domain-containing protein n=1 Tax=Moheibacter sediminis TaxID=1434700 RepID=A0A1W2CGK6_9FLAO|nr:Omp28-related outer membrane protein [Moheibacter sediminis]SMC84397.1 Por secretion system C-terminal sorting domain-containing protein [Moheibacter sediminis]
MKNIFTKFLLVGLAPLAAYGQTIVSTTPENRKVILEEFTGINCVYCPQGHVIAEQILENNPGKAFAINIHQGGFATPQGGQPDFRTPFGNAIANQTGLTGYPSGTVNRHVFFNNKTILDRGQWASSANQLLNLPSYVNMAVEASVDIDTRVLTVHVESYYTGDSPQSTNRLNVALLQNNTTGPQTGGNQGNNYNHMRRLVHLITGQWGEEVTTTTTGSFVNKNYTYTIPESYNNIPAILSNLEIVVFMSESQQEIISGNGTFPALIGLEHENDASIKQIREIPKSCTGNASPIVEIENLGGNLITSLTFNYSINSGEPLSYTWTGTIAPLVTKEIQLPEIVYSAQETNTLSVSIQDDENSENNQLSLDFLNAISTESTTLTLEIHTDGFGNQTRWNIRNSNNQTIKSGYGYGNNQTYTETIDLPANDCYTLNVIDVSNNGGAAISLKDENGVILSESDGNYGSGYSEDFAKGALGVDDLSSLEISVYPNPTTGIVNINSKVPNAQIEVFDASGRKMYSVNSTKQLTTIDLSSYGKGIYLVKVAEGKNIITKKVIVK